MQCARAERMQSACRARSERMGMVSVTACSASAATPSGAARVSALAQPGGTQSSYSLLCNAARACVRVRVRVRIRVKPKR